MFKMSFTLSSVSFWVRSSSRITVCVLVKWSKDCEKFVAVEKKKNITDSSHVTLWNKITKYSQLVSLNKNSRPVLWSGLFPLLIQNGEYVVRKTSHTILVFFWAIHSIWIVNLDCFEFNLKRLRNAVLPMPLRFVLAIF